MTMHRNWSPGERIPGRGPCMAPVMQPPVLHDSSLMRMHGEREGRGWMEQDPSAPHPSAASLFYLGALIAGTVLFIGYMHAQA